MRFLRYAQRGHYVLIPALIFAFDFQWIEGVGLNKRTIRSYRCLNHGGPSASALEGFHLSTLLFLVNYPELNEIRSLIPVYQRIIKSHAKRLRSIPGDVDSNEDEDDREDGLIVKRADLVDEIHRLCAGIVDILSEWAKSPERNAEEKCGCYREYVSLLNYSVISGTLS